MISLGKLRTQIEAAGIQPSSMLLSRKTWEDLLDYGSGVPPDILEQIMQNTDKPVSIRASRNYTDIRTINGDIRERIPGIASYYLQYGGQEYAISQHLAEEISAILREDGDTSANDFAWED